MIDYIEQMMETAGVEPKLIASYTFKCGYNKKQYEKDIIEPPDFTAEKQLILENLIIKEVGYIRIDYTKEIQDKIPLSYQYNIFGGSYEVHSKNYVASTRAEALAQLTTELMKAGELDKEKVKEVLEG